MKIRDWEFETMMIFDVNDAEVKILDRGDNDDWEGSSLGKANQGEGLAWRLQAISWRSLVLEGWVISKGKGLFEEDEMRCWNLIWIRLN